jgi:phosphoribosylaminoimidazole-succinocarboxamide synthase
MAVTSHAYTQSCPSPGSAWAEYKNSGTAHGIPLRVPEGLQESQKLPTPLFTPSTKAEQGAHDENISRDQGDVPIPPPPTTPNKPIIYNPMTQRPATLGKTAAALIGTELYDRVSHVALKLYTAAAEHAAMRGLIIADTKFEFGLVDHGRRAHPHR